jgi:hypothetical protein
MLLFWRAKRLLLLTSLEPGPMSLKIARLDHLLEQVLRLVLEAVQDAVLQMNQHS